MGVILLAGCSEKESAPPPNNPAPAPLFPAANPASSAPPPSAGTPIVATPPSAGVPAAASTEPGPAPGSLLVGVDRDYVPHVISLNMAYQSYYSVHMKGPDTVEDLVTAKQITEVPPVPPGKKYQVDNANQRIIVVNK